MLWALGLLRLVGLMLGVRLLRHRRLPRGLRRLKRLGNRLRGGLGSKVFRRLFRRLFGWFLGWQIRRRLS